MTPSKRSIEERADRYQRRYRRGLHIDYIRANVAVHDLWTHAIGRGLAIPVIRRLARALDPATTEPKEPE